MLAPASADASRIVYTCGEEMALCALDPSTRKSTRLTKDGGFYYPNLSRDGRVMAFTRGGAAYVADGRARKRRLLETKGGGWYNEPVLRPDGRALVADRAGIGGTCLISLPGLGAKCRDSHNVYWGTSRWLYGHDFERDPDGPTLCHVKLGTWRCSGPVIFRGLPGYEYTGYGADVSPDGRLIARGEHRFGDENDVHISIFDTRTLKRVRQLTSGRHDTAPVWSPDGRNVLFTRTDGLTGPANLHAFELWRVPARGGRARRLVSGATTFPVRTDWGG